MVKGIKDFGTRNGNSAGGRGGFCRVIDEASFDPREQADDRKSQVSRTGKLASCGWWNGFARLGSFRWVILTFIRFGMSA